MKSMDIPCFLFSFLDRHIQRRCGLVQEQQAGTRHDSRGDHGSLKHSAGELVRILVVHFLGIRQFYVLKSLDRSLFAFLGAEIRMNLQNFFHLFSDLHERIHGAHRFLKDYADLVSLYFAKERPVCVEHIFAVYQDVAPVITLFAGNFCGEGGRRCSSP